MAIARNQRTVLEFLAGCEGEVAGIEVADAIGGLARSSAYAALAALQRDGLVLARWDTSGSHPRRLVRLSAAGRRALASLERPQPKRAGRRAAEGAS